MNIVRQIIAKTKAMDVINSCVNGDQFESAENYIELYNERFQDFLGYNDLKRELQRVRVESLSPSR